MVPTHPISVFMLLVTMGFYLLHLNWLHSKHLITMLLLQRILSHKWLGLAVWESA